MTRLGTGAAGSLASVLWCATVGLATLLQSPAAPWPSANPAEVGMDPAALDAFSSHIGGHGCVARGGRLVHSWGEFDKPRDVASACKPVFTHLLLTAAAEGRVPSLDQPLAEWEPRLRELNPDLQFKDRGILWRHLIEQTSCYGLLEHPGTAFAYNDWQMALFVDTLFGKVYGVPWADVDRLILQPRLTEPIGCEDQPTLTAEDRPAVPAGRSLGSEHHPGAGSRSFRHTVAIARHDATRGHQRLETAARSAHLGIRQNPGQSDRSFRQLQSSLVDQWR
ncbi:MAG: beta-lactamase family protein [Nitrospira sp.]|nr:beta-lactamase family protein [Nitrospira sp.]